MEVEKTGEMFFFFIRELSKNYVTLLVQRLVNILDYFSTQFRFVHKLKKKIKTLQSMYARYVLRYRPRYVQETHAGLRSNFIHKKNK